MYIWFLWWRFAGIPPPLYIFPYPGTIAVSATLQTRVSDEGAISIWNSIQAQMTCSCGSRYDDLRTGYTFGEVRRMLSRTERKYVRRNGVLGFWHELKLQLWNQYHGDCS